MIMKKILKTFLLLSCLFLLCGCLRTRTELTVKDDGSVDMATVVLLSEEILQQSGPLSEEDLQEAAQEMTASYQQQGGTGTIEPLIETYQDTRYFGFRVSGVENELKAVKADGRWKLEIPAAAALSTLFGETGYSPAELQEALQSGASAELVVTMPRNASSNVGVVKGKTVTIDLLNIPEGTSSFVITCSAGIPLSTWLLIAAAILLAVSFFFLKKKKSSSEELPVERELPAETPAEETPEAPAEPDPPVTEDTEKAEEPSIPQYGEMLRSMPPAETENEETKTE